MGSRWTAVLHAPAADAPALSAALADAVEAVEREMSSWRAESDLMRLNAAPVGVWVDLPADLAHVLDAALRRMRSDSARQLDISSSTASTASASAADSAGASAAGA